MRSIALVAFTLMGTLLFPGSHAHALTVAPSAHEPGQSYMFLRVHEDSLVVRLEVRAEDLSNALGLDWADGSLVDAQDVAQVLPRIRSYAEERFGLAADGSVIPLQFVESDLRFLDWGNFVILTYVTGELPEIPDELEITFSLLFETNADHRDIVVIEHNWKTGTFNNESNISLIMSPSSPTQVLDLTSSSVWRGFVAMTWQGVWHILIGLDHILFLVALVLPSVLVRKEGKWEPAPSFRSAFMKLVGIVTFFTIAHSVTLSMAALDVVRFPSRIVEAVIAASIAVAAMANLMPKLNIKEWAIAFGFGLFHGFGFASVLGDIGLAREFLVLTLLGFNVGVELGQIAIIAVVFPILFMLRKTTLYTWLFRWGSVLLILASTLWVFERLLGFDIPLRRMARRVLG